MAKLHLVTNDEIAALNKLLYVKVEEYIVSTLILYTLID